MTTSTCPRCGGFGGECFDWCADQRTVELHAERRRLHRLLVERGAIRAQSAHPSTPAWLALVGAGEGAW